MIVRRSPDPLYAQIAQVIRDRIESEHYRPLAQLPSEGELAAEFNVSRMTARKAFDALVSQGIAFRRPGKGTFVAGAKIAHRFSTMVSFSAAIADLGLSLKTKVLEAGKTAAEGEVAAALQVERASPVVRVQRLRIVENEPAALHTVYLPARLEELLQQDLTGSLHDLMRAAGAVVRDTQDWVEAVTATPDVAERLKVPSGVPMVRVWGVAFSSAREPLRLTDALYRGDRFRFSVDSTGISALQVAYGIEGTSIDATQA